MAEPSLKPYVRAWQARFEATREERRRLAQGARAKLEAIVSRLVNDYGVYRVWLFGSLAEGGFNEHSDIDLAVEGLAGGATLYRAAADLDELARPFEIDLVPLDEARPSLRRRILERGVLLHDRG